MSWQAKPQWDTCWDFSKNFRRKAAGNQSQQQWQGGGKGRKQYGAWEQWEDPAWAPYWSQPWSPLAYQSWAQLGAQGAASTEREEAAGGVLAPSMEKRLQEGKAQMPVPAPPPDKEYEGSLKSMSTRHHYGFIVCQESHRLYGRDVYLPADQVPEGAEVGDRLRFMISLSAKGHPQAAKVTIAGKI